MLSWTLLNNVQQQGKSVLRVPDCPGPASWAWRRRGWPTETTWAAGWRPEGKLKTPDLDLNATQKRHILTCLITSYCSLLKFSINIFTCIRNTNSAILFTLFFLFEFDLNWMRQPPTFENISKAAKRVYLYVQRRTESRSICQRGLCIKGQIHASPVWEYFSPVYEQGHWCVLPIWRKRISLTICLRSVRRVFFLIILVCSCSVLHLHLMPPTPAQVSWWYRTWSLQWRRWRSRQTCWCRSWCSTLWWSPWKRKG